MITGVTVDPNKITVIAEGDNLKYSLDNINWQTSNIFYNLQQGGLNTIHVRSNGFLPISIKIPIYKVSNFFSPNGDGYNDTWKLYPEGMLEASRIIIVDKNAGTVYEKSPISVLNGTVRLAEGCCQPIHTGIYLKYQQHNIYQQQDIQSLLC